MSNNKTFRPDSKQTGALVKAGKAAAIDARRDSKAQGISVTFIKGNSIYREYADGRTEKIGNTAQSNDAISINKGTILRRAR